MNSQIAASVALFLWLVTLAATAGMLEAGRAWGRCARLSLSHAQVIEWLRFGRPSLVGILGSHNEIRIPRFIQRLRLHLESEVAVAWEGLCVGAIAGFATITPAAGYVQPWGASKGSKKDSQTCQVLLLT